MHIVSFRYFGGLNATEIGRLLNMPMIGTDSNGNPVIIDRHDRTGFTVAQVNALTGEYICYGSTLADNFSLDFFTCADDIKQVLIYPGSWEPEPAG